MFVFSVSKFEFRVHDLYLWSSSRIRTAVKNIVSDPSKTTLMTMKRKNPQQPLWQPAFSGSLGFILPEFQGVNKFDFNLLLPNMHTYAEQK